PNVDHSAPPLVVTDAEEIEEEEEVFEDEIVLEEVPTEEEKLDEVEVVVEAPSSDREVESHFDELAATETEPSMNVVQLDTLLPEIQRLEEIETTHSGGTAFAGRGRLQRTLKVSKEGGNTLTEKAVEEALKWIARHQNPTDGGFSFEHRVANCKCGNTGSHGRNGATGLALLPFLGAGYTHQAGPYKKEIGAALSFLIRQMKPHKESQGGSLWEEKGQMYSHGLCAIALAEAYGMTKDSRLRAPTLAALRYIVYAQDPKGGGWRYKPREGGDTSVVGWQLMALKSGKMAGIDIPEVVLRRANHFLKSVSAESGTWYGYTGSAKGRYATTAVGHLSRMYLGVGRDDPSLQRGVVQMDKRGPNFGDMYYNYYASQVMHHYGGQPWDRWNRRMRDTLIDRQEKRGHEKGSWMFSGSDHGFKAGGRLYSTAMAAMMLEVYYRHMPLYQDKTAELEGWDLE
ncbi:MAG: terpene cyclase/mutase family protein, partial [Pirellulales bacterium]|nr:terpene cyclase/mutase family protein [Pirellulales bacterium]